MAEVTSERVTLADLRVARVPPSVARNAFEKHGINWQRFTEEGIATTDLAALDDAILQKIVEAATTDAQPMEVEGEIRVYMRHVRSAQLCARGSREFFRKHGLDWNDFLTNGIPVSKLEEIGDPIALRAAHEAIEEEANGRRG